MKPRHQLSRTPPNMKKIANEMSKKNDAIKSCFSFQCESLEETKIISPNNRGTYSNRIRIEKNRNR